MNQPVSVNVNGHIEEHLYKYPMHPNLAAHIEREIRKNRIVVIKGTRLKNLMHYIMDRCDEEPYQTLNLDQLSEKDRVRLEKIKKICENIRDDANIKWL